MFNEERRWAAVSTISCREMPCYCLPSILSSCSSSCSNRAFSQSSDSLSFFFFFFSAMTTRDTAAGLLLIAETAVDLMTGIRVLNSQSSWGRYRSDRTAISTQSFLSCLSLSKRNRPHTQSGNLIEYIVPLCLSFPDDPVRTVFHPFLPRERNPLSSLYSALISTKVYRRKQQQQQQSLFQVINYLRKDGDGGLSSSSSSNSSSPFFQCFHLGKPQRTSTSTGERASERAASFDEKSRGLFCSLSPIPPPPSDVVVVFLLLLFISHFSF